MLLQPRSHEGALLQSAPEEQAECTPGVTTCRTHRCKNVAVDGCGNKVSSRGGGDMFCFQLLISEHITVFIH